MVQRPGRAGEKVRVDPDRVKSDPDDERASEIPARSVDLIAGLLAGMRLVGRSR